MGVKIRIGLLYGGAESKTGDSLAGPVWDTEKYDTETVFIPDNENGPDPAALQPLDVLFPMMDAARACRNLGRLFGIVEQAGSAWAGPCLRQAVVGADRALIRKVLAQDGLPQRLFRSFTRLQWERETAFHRTEIEVSVGYPCLVQTAYGPVRAGGVKVHNREELDAAVARLLSEDNRVIVEEWVGGRTYLVALLGGALSEQSVIGEASTVQGGSGKRMLAAAGLTEETEDSVRKLAVQACGAVDANGCVLVKVTEAGDDRRLLLDAVELFPDLSPDSTFAGLWELSGKLYPDLADRLVELALERHKATGTGG